MTSRITCGHGHQEGQCPCPPCDFHLPSKAALFSTIAEKDAEIERLRHGLSVIATQSTVDELQEGLVEEVGDYQEGYDTLVKHARKILRGEG